MRFDWGELELAFDASEDDPHRVSLDRETGKLVIWMRGDIDPREDDEGVIDPDRWVDIDGRSSHVEFEWMESFAAAAQGRLRDELTRALAGSRPFRRFKDALERFPADRERWSSHRQARVTRWIAENDLVRDLGEPPWVEALASAPAESSKDATRLPAAEEGGDGEDGGAIDEGAGRASSPAADGARSGKNREGGRSGGKRGRAKRERGGSDADKLRVVMDQARNAT